MSFGGGTQWKYFGNTTAKPQTTCSGKLIAGEGGTGRDRGGLNELLSGSHLGDGWSSAGLAKPLSCVSDEDSSISAWISFTFFLKAFLAVFVVLQQITNITFSPESRTALLSTYYKTSQLAFCQ